jgi:hypothetical protein
VESAGARLERTSAFRIHARRAGLHRLGRAAACIRCTATDGRTLVERARRSVVGRTQDRGAGGPSRAFLVGALRAC